MSRRSRPQDEQGDDSHIIHLYRFPVRLTRLLAAAMDTPESQQQRGSSSINRQMGQNLQQDADVITRGRPFSREVTRRSIKQSTSPTPADDAVTVLSLQQAYPRKVVKQTQFLHVVRPFKGCGVDKLSDFDRRPKNPTSSVLEMEASKTKVIAIDVALILFRHLLSLESNLCIAEDMITLEKSGFHKAA